MRVVVCAVAVGLGLLGCTDNPQDKAAKELDRITQESLALARQGWRIDEQTKEVVSAVVYADARKKLQGAIAKAPQAGTEAASSAYFAGGNLNFAEARSLRVGVSGYTAKVSDKADRISQLTPKIIALEAQGERIEHSEKVTADAIVGMQVLLDGDGVKKGLKAKLADAEAELKDLEGQKQQRLEMKEAAQRQANTIEQIAMQKLSAAELAKGQEKAKLEKDAFELKLSMKGPLAKAQDAENQAVMLQSKINVAGPKAEKLRADVEHIGGDVDAMANSPQRAQLLAEVEDIKRRVAKLNEEVAGAVGELGKATGAYSEYIGQMVKLMDDCVLDYGRVRSRSLRDAGALGLAEGNFWKASIMAEEMTFRRHVGGRLESMASGIGGQAGTVLSEASGVYLQQDEEKVKTILTAYDEADVQYEQAGSGKDVMANRALSLYGKFVFADQLGDIDMAIGAKNKATEIYNQIKERDPMFVASITGKLVSGTGDFIPPMAIDLTEQYEEIRRQLGSWKSLRGDQAKARVEELLAMLDNMKPPIDPGQFTSERDAMEAALKRGFDQQASSDPNFF